MSKSKEQYFEEGVQAAKAGESAPVVAANASWQVKAFAAGYNSVEVAKPVAEVVQPEPKPAKRRLKLEPAKAEPVQPEQRVSNLVKYIPPAGAHFDPSAPILSPYVHRLILELHQLRTRHGYILTQEGDNVSYKPPKNVRPQVAKQVSKLKNLLQLARVP